MIKSSHGFLNTLLSEQNGPHFADNIFKYLFWIKMLVFSIKFQMVKFDYMMTSSNGNIFRVTGPLCGEFTGPGEFPT